MLHYFAKRFYSNPALSSFIDGDDIKLHFVKDMLPKTEEQNVRLRFRSFSASRPKTGFITFSMNKNTLPLKIMLFKWNSLTPIAQKKLEVRQPVSTSEKIYQHSIKDLLKRGNTSKNELLLVFEATSDNSTLYNWIPLAYYREINLLKPKLQIKMITKITATQFTIDLITENIAAYVWLEVNNCEGYFSDNGFLMYRKQYTVNFYSWNACSNINDLSIQSLNDMYF